MKNINSKFNIILTVLTFILILLLSVDVKAQSWAWAQGGGGTASDFASETCVDPFGNFYVAGTFNSTSINVGTLTVNNSGASGFDVYVAKFNSNGNVLWAARIGGASAESVSGICTDASGRVYVAGTYNSTLLSLPPFTSGNPGSGTYNVYLACIDASGVPQWMNTFGGTGNEYSGGVAYSAFTSGVYLTGTFFDPTLAIGTATLTNPSSSGKAEMYLAKYNNVGTFQWAQRAGSAGCDDWGSSIAVDGTGSPCVFGTYSGTVVAATTTIGTQALTSFGNQDMYIAKYSNSGTFVWARGLGSSSGGDFPGGIEADASNNFYISGTYQNTSLVVGTNTLTSYGNSDMFIAKYNSSGTAQWAQKAGGTSDDYGYDVSVDGSGNAYLTGTYSGTVISVGATNLNNTVAGSSTDLLVAKYSATGSVLWATKAGGSGNENGNSVAADAVGNVYAVGTIGGTTTFGTYTVSSLGGVDLFVGKIGCLTTQVSGFSTVCEGASVSLNATGATSYSWSTGATTASISVSPTISTNYTVTGTTGSCVGTPATFSVTFLPASLNTGSNLNLLCKQNAVINATCNPPSPVSVTWSPPTNLSNPSSLNPTVTAGAPTVYNVNVTLSNGCIKTGSISVSSYAQTPDICQVTVDSLGVNNEIYWEKTLYPQADSFIVYREVSTNVYKRIAGLSRTAFSMYVDTNRSIGPANGDPNLTYYKYKLQIKDSCGNLSPLSKWHETIFIQDQLNGNFNWNMYAIESMTSTPITLYNLKRRMVSTGTETLITSTTGGLATDPLYNSFWPLNVKWFVDAQGFNCSPTSKIMVTKTKTKSNQSNDKIALGILGVNATNLIRVYPNPAKDILNIDLNGLEKTELTIEIRNMLGQLVYKTQSLNQFLVISTNLISSGVYSVNVIQNNKTIFIKKIVVENNQ